MSGCCDRLLCQVAVTGCCVRLLCQVVVSGCCDRLLFANTFVCFVLTDRSIELACCSRLLVSSVPRLECEKAERGNLHILGLRVKSKGSTLCQSTVG